MIEELHQLMLLTLILGVVCTIASRVVIGRWFTPATWYWLVWTGCLFSYDYVLTQDMLPGPEPLTISVLKDAHMGAFWGFIVMSILSRFFQASRQRERTTSTLVNLEFIDLKKVDQLIWIYFLVAAALLIYRIATVGKVDLAFLQAARESFIGKDKSAIRPLLFIVPISVPLAIILSSRLASGTAKIHRPLILLAICFITGMADASRMKILQVLALAAITISTTLDEEHGRRFKTLFSKYWLGTLVGGISLIVLLQTIQVIRSTGSLDLLLEDPLLVIFPTSLMAYLAQGTSAMALFYEAANGPIVGGDLTFAFPMKYGAILGLNDTPLTKADVFGHVLGVLDDPRVQKGGISGVGVLLTDFGPENVWLASFWMARILQFLFAACINRGFIGRALAICCCMGSLFSVLHLWFLSAAMVMGIVWCFLVARWLHIPLWESQPGFGEQGERGLDERIGAS